MDILNGYLDDLKLTRSVSTFETYGFLLKPFDAWLKTKGKSLNDCSYTDAYAFLDTQEWSNYTKNMFITILKQMFRWYSVRITVGGTPEEQKRVLEEKQRCDLIYAMRYPTKLKYQDRDEKIKGLILPELSTLLSKANKKDRVRIYLLAYFGFRKGEFIRYVREENIDFGVGRIKFVRSKTYEIQYLYFNEYVGGLLREYLKDPVTIERELNTMLSKYTYVLNFHLYPHIFRGTFNSQMRAVVKDNLFVKLLMGHRVKKQDMTLKYTDKRMLDNILCDIMLNHHYMNGLLVDGTKKP